MNRIIIPEYLPYKNLHPAIIGFLIDKEMNARDFSAGIIRLVQKKYLKMEKIEGSNSFFGGHSDYLFTSLVNIYKVDDDLDKLFLQLIFLDNPINIDIFVGKIEKDEIYDKKDKFRTFSVRLSELSYNFERLKSKRAEIKKEVEKYAYKNKIIRRLHRGWILPTMLFSLLAFILLFLAGYRDYALLTILPFFAAWILGQKNNKEYTEYGLEVQNNIEGFKMYLDVAEKDRMEVLNAPELNPKDFLEYLPYAISLNVEEGWKREFEKITTDSFLLDLENDFMFILRVFIESGKN